MSQPLNPCSSVPVASAKVTEEILPSTPSFDLNQETLSIKHSPTLLDLNATERADATSSRPLALMMARNIHDLDKIVYPKGIKIPDVELNKGAMQGGKFKYDRDFLLQFMAVCKDRPDRFVPLPGFGVERSEVFPERLGGGRGKQGGGWGLSHAPGPNHRHALGATNSFLSPLGPLLPANSCTGFGTPKPEYGYLPTDKKATVNRKVTALLNKLTTEKFDSISDQIIDWANTGEQETDGKTLIDVLRLVFDKAMDESTRSVIYAKLCEKMMEQISSDVRDDSLRDHERNSIAGKQLFRGYILNRYQEDFQRIQNTVEAAIASAVSNGGEDDAKAANTATMVSTGYQQEDDPPYSGEYYVVLQAKRRSLGLITFIGELFKLSVVTEQIVHDCIEKLLKGIELPREEHQIESLCTLLALVGRVLDTEKNENQMNVCFERMVAVAAELEAGSRLHNMLQDVIDLRGRKWMMIPFNGQAASERYAGIANGKLPMANMSEAKVWTRGWRRKNNNDNLEQKQPPDWQQPSMRFEPVRPLAPVNSCTGFGNQKPRYRCQLTKQDKEALMNRKVTSLLNKLTTKTFDSISDEIIEWANKSEHETDEKTLIDFLRLIFDKAIDESRWSEMYAKLCEKMVEQVSLGAGDRGLRSRQWRSMAGKQLLRKFIRDRCQEALERSWSTMEVAIASAASKKEEDDAKAANAAAVAKARCQEERVSLYSEEYYAALKAKRRAADLITFVGELFKLSIITERIVHECIEKLLKEIELLREEHQIKSLCTLLAMVGQMLDTQKNKNQIDVYFKRMAAVAVKPGIGSMMQYMLQDVIDLRGRNWITIRAFNEQAANERTAGLANGKLPMGSGGAGRDERITIGSEGINGTSPGGKPLDPASTTVCAPPAKAGDISQFGKTIKSGDIISMCPSSVFKKGGRPTNGHGDNGLGVNGPRGEDASGPAVGRRPVATGSNMFSLLSDTGSIESGSRQTNMNTKREPMAPKVDVSVTLSPSSTAGLIGAPSSMSKRKKIKLLPKNPPVPAHTWPPVATPRQVEAPNIALEE